MIKVATFQNRPFYRDGKKLVQVWQRGGPHGTDGWVWILTGIAERKDEHPVDISSG